MLINQWLERVLYFETNFIRWTQGKTLEGALEMGDRR